MDVFVGVKDGTGVNVGGGVAVAGSGGSTGVCVKGIAAVGIAFGNVVLVTEKGVSTKTRLSVDWLAQPVANKPIDRAMLTMV
jgi:hypothetical protein